MSTEVTAIVDPDSGAGYDYASLNAAIAGELGGSPVAVTGSDLVTNDERLLVQCRCTGGSADTTHPGDLGGFTTGSDDYVRIFVEDGYRHQGDSNISGNVYRVSTGAGGGISFNVTDQYTRLEYIAWINTESGTGYANFNVHDTNGANSTLLGCLADSGGTTGGGASFSGPNANISFINCFAIDTPKGFGDCGLLANNTVRNAGTGFDGHWSARGTYINNIVDNSTTSFGGSSSDYHSDSDYNAGDDTIPSSFFTNGINNPTVVFSTTTGCLITSGATGLIRAGVGWGYDNRLPTIDIIGRNRHGNWPRIGDVGASRYAAETPVTYAPTSIVSHSGFASTPTVSQVNADDTTYAEPSNNNTSINLVVGFATPSGTPQTGAGLCRMNVIVRPNAVSPGTGTATAQIEIYESGSALSPVVQSSTFNVTASDGDIAISLPFNAADLASSDLSNVECRVIGTASGGGPSARISVAVDAIELVVDESTALSIAPSGIASLEAFGSPTVAPGAVSVQPGGIASLEAFGAHTVSLGGSTQNLLPGGIGSLEAFGSATVAPGAVSVQPGGIASLEAFGTLQINQQIIAQAIASAETFGAATITPGGVNVLPGGIISAEAFGNPTVLAGSLLIQANGIASAETFGSLVIVPGSVTITPNGIETGEAFGTVVVNSGIVVFPNGIASLESFGNAVLATGAVVILPNGIETGEAFGTLQIIGGDAGLAILEMLLSLNPAIASTLEATAAIETTIEFN